MISRFAQAEGRSPGSSRRVPMRAFWGILFFLLFLSPSQAESPKTTEPAASATPEFKGEILPISAERAAAMRGVSWHPGCPVALEDLRNVQVSYWGFDNQAHSGDLIVHKEVAKEVLAIFSELYSARFPIEKLRPVSEHGGDDAASMAANNSSAFNCRRRTGNRKRYSNHAYGKAIDINPVQNPYVYKEKVLPEAGRAYLNRNKPAKGLIRRGDVCQQAFKRHGWSWGGLWRRNKDYQHFEKRL